MKILSIISITLIASTSLSQHGVNYPKDLEIEPNDYRLRNLQIKRIVQSEISERVYADTTAERKQFSVTYIIDYDSLFQVSL